MAFSFGFSGDDIEEDPNDAQNVGEKAEGGEENGPPPIPARTHALDEMLSSLPDRLSYNLFTAASPKGHTATLPRRELFDVRLQLMAEDDVTSTTSPDTNPLAALSSTDLSPNIYEGGYKTWECSIDLVSFLLDRGPRKDLDDIVRVNHVIEMGCGTALPSLLLFQYAIRNRIPLYFTLTDYNADVLRLVTVPNLLLTYISTLGATDAPFSEFNPNPLAQQAQQEASEENASFVEITPEIISHFTNTLSSIGITLTLVSGSWLPTPTLLSLIPSSPELNTFLLASETIYSPSSLSAFTEAMAELLKRVKTGKAIVAAKRVYFGVGGSVDGFREECSRKGCVAYEVDFEGLESNGVRRCLLEVQMF